MRKFRTYAEVDPATGSEVLEQVVAQGERLARRMEGVRHLTVVASGKGGVGKSAVTANLAAALAARGRTVGAVDADLNGPSLARMLGAAGQSLEVRESGVRPAVGAAGVRLISMDLLLASADAPLRWREPSTAGFAWQSSLETGALREFLADCDWGKLDHLVIDLPPGTDKLARLFQLLPSPSAVLLVTTPSEAARVIVSKSLRLTREAGVARCGLVANMSGYVCDGCGRRAELFHADGARSLSEETGVPLWAEIPFDARLAARTDMGEPLVLSEPETAAAAALEALADRLEVELAREAEATP